MFILRFLNEYANLLLVLVTTIYVVLTWLTLNALRRASFREHELRHLEDMKREVSQPIIGWLDNEIVPMLRGEYRNLIQVTSKPHIKPHVPIGERQYEYRKTLDHAPLNLECMSNGLYLHAKSDHFSAQVKEFEMFVSDLRKYAGEMAVFARESADTIASQSTLPRSDDSGMQKHFADVEAIVESSLRELLGGHAPSFYLGEVLSGDVQVTDSQRSTPLARGPNASTREWLSLCASIMEERWARSVLRVRAKQLAEEAKHVRGLIEELQFTYSLPGSCKYVLGDHYWRSKIAWLRGVGRKVSH